MAVEISAGIYNVRVCNIDVKANDRGQTRRYNFRIIGNLKGAPGTISLLYSMDADGTTFSLHMPLEAFQALRELVDAAIPLRPEIVDATPEPEEAA